jgi:hypothetical protein
VSGVRTGWDGEAGDRHNGHACHDSDSARTTTRNAYDTIHNASQSIAD